MQKLFFLDFIFAIVNKKHDKTLFFRSILLSMVSNLKTRTIFQRFRPQVQTQKVT